MRVLILHAKGEDDIAAKLVRPLENAGYRTFRDADILTGESFIGETEKVLREGGPVVLCGTCKAVGSRSVLSFVRAAKSSPEHRVRIFFASMEPDAALEEYSFDTVVSECWRDFDAEIDKLVAAIQHYYPLSQKTTEIVPTGIERLLAEQPKNPLILALRDALPDVSEAQHHPWWTFIDQVIKFSHIFEDTHDERFFPWSDSSWAYRIVEQAGILCDTVGSATSMRSGELALLIVTPFLLQALLVGEVTKDAFDNRNQEASIFLAGHDRLVSRSLALKDKFPDTAEAVMAWLRLRFAMERRATWSTTSPPSQLQGLIHEIVTQEMNPWMLPNKIVYLLRAGSGLAIDDKTVLESTAHTLLGETSSIRWHLLAALLVLSERLTLRSGDLPEVLLHHLMGTNGPTLKDIYNDVVNARFTLERDLRLVVLQAECRLPVVDFALGEVAMELDHFLRRDGAAIAAILRQNGFRPLAGCRTEVTPVALDGSPAYVKPHVTFTMEPEDVRQLLMGTQLWGDPTFAYRELYQNALDACRYRRCRSQFLDIPYEPRIRFHEGKTADGRAYLECEDNGIGMTLGIIRSCFARAGQRFAETAEFQRELSEWKTKGISMTPNSQFGIGVFSYFLVSDEIEVETCRLGPDGVPSNERLLVRIPAPSRLFSITILPQKRAREDQLERQADRGDPADARLDAGTRVRLYLKQETSSSDVDTSPEGRRPAVHCHKALRRMIWMAEVKIRATTSTGVDYFWAAGELAPWLQPHVGTLEKGADIWWILEPLPEEFDAPNRSTAFVARSWQGMSLPGESDPTKRYTQYIGRILVDGIATDHAVPCAIINLTGQEMPKLSLDRRELRSPIQKSVYSKIATSIDKISMAQVFSSQWIATMYDAWPRESVRLCARVEEEPGKWEYTKKGWAAWTGTARERRFFPADHLPMFQGNNFIEKALFTLWRNAHWAKDIQRINQGHRRNAEPAYGIDKIASRSAYVDERVVHAWHTINAGPCEAAAIAYMTSAIMLRESGISGNDFAYATSLYTSWISGCSIADGAESARLAHKILDIPITSDGLERALMSPVDHISSRDAMLLRGGWPATPPWRTDGFSTRHLLLLGEHTSSNLDGLWGELTELSDRLRVPLTVTNLSKLKEILPLSEADRTLIALLDLDSISLSFAILNYRAHERCSTRRAVERIDQILSSIGGAAISWDLDAVVKILESNEIADIAAALKIRHKAGQFVANALSPFGIAALSMDKNLPIDTCIEHARRVAEAFRINFPKIDHVQLAQLKSIGEEDDWWLLELRGTAGSSRASRQLTAAELAFVHSNHRNPGMSLRKFAERVRMLSPSLGWAEPPWIIDELQSLFGNYGKLSYDDERLLRADPASVYGPIGAIMQGRYSVGRMIVLSLEIEKPLWQLHDRLLEFRVLDVAPPEDGATYLGVSWGDLVERSRQG